MRKLTEEDFWVRVYRRSNDECWPWLGARMGRYGGFGRREYAHRASWRINKGRIPDGLEVLHKCDSRLCVNPNHLYLGTQIDNIHDVSVRNPTVLASGKLSRLGRDGIIEIRSMYNTGKYRQIDLARLFSISPSYVWSVVNGICGDHTISEEV